ncbi:MAG: hypothetical protein HOC23_22355 [Halieaceae bacterium]|nr:hypothetical protein [Halieaceae bacterium]
MLKSELVSDATASDDTNQFVLESLGLEHDGPVQYMLMRSEYADQIVVCALVGGEIIGNDLNLTPVGTGAYEALCLLPGDEVAMYALSDNDETMAQQIPNTIAEHKTGARLCFIGSNLVERQAQIFKAFALGDAKRIAA